MEGRLEEAFPFDLPSDPFLARESGSPGPPTSVTDSVLVRKRSCQSVRVIKPGARERHSKRVCQDVCCVSVCLSCWLARCLTVSLSERQHIQRRGFANCLSHRL